MKKTIRTAKALTDPNRLRALAALRQGELCVCQLIELLGLVPSTVSKHMSILRNAELVEGEKRGKWMYYSLPPKKSNPAVSAILKWVIDQIENDSVVMRDGLLSFVGGKMIFESFKASEEKIPIPKSAEAIRPFHPLPYEPRHSME